MNKFIWLSSYPKSGNTWLRYLIANYFFNQKNLFDYKIISSIKSFPIDDVIEKISNKEELIKDPYKISQYWIQSQELMKIKSGNVAFLKNHNALVNINNNELTNEKISLAAIHIVRDPRDVAVSYANYKNLNYDKIIENMCSKNLRYEYKLNKNNFPKIEILGSWKFHYLSWKNGIPNIPRILIKYEDLVDDCFKVFYNVIYFLSKILKFEINEDKIKFCVNFANFKNLKNYEIQNGFYENDSNSSFFNSGKSGNWINILNKDQIKKIEEEFKDVMKSLDYL